MKHPGIYKITNIINKRFYIGRAVDIHARWNTHRSERFSYNKFMNEDFMKYGKESFYIEVLEVVNNVSDLPAIEDGYLKENMKSDLCYNMYPREYMSTYNRIKSLFYRRLAENKRQMMLDGE